MPERPLLLFPSRSKISYEKKGGGGEKDFQKPSKLKQSVRIDSMFKRINKAFDAHRASIDLAADGLAPEMVLVFETRGAIPEFFKAVRNIPELKWLGEQEGDFPATDDFKYENSTKPIPGKLFFLLADNAAIKELRSLWNTWKNKKQEFKSGTTKWRHLFDLLVDIRPWGVKDRLQETGIVEDLQYRIRLNQEVIPFEIELWYRKSSGQRAINRERIINLILGNDGRLISETDLEDISYHAILAEAPIGIFNQLTEETSVSLFRSTDIMYIRPVGQSVLKIEEELIAEAGQEVLPPPLVEYPSLIALLDGFPIQNHLYLRDRIDVYDPDGLEENYPAAKRVHGTGMASLIVHGDLNDNNIPIKTRLLIRPVMQYRFINDQTGEEVIPDNILLVDLIHRAVKEIVEGDNMIPAIAPSVKVINLSLGDSYRVFDGMMSPWARLIDWLSEKYNLLFIISAGNSLDELSIASEENGRGQVVEDLGIIQTRALRYLYNKNRFRKIISPAESINGLTIGASHADANAEFTLNNNFNVFQNSSLLSPISRMGLGFRKSIKPDILAKGGIALFRNAGNGVLRLSKVNTVPPGIKVASPGGAGNGVIYSIGTSNAAAIVTHTAAKIYETFLEDEYLRNRLTNDYFAVTAKALLVHGASWDGEAKNIIDNSIENVTNRRELISRFLGYGNLDSNRIIECTDKRVTLIGCESIMPDTAYIYELPLPDVLSGKINWRKLSVTLAWLTPINTSNQLYRTHKLWFDFPGRDYDVKLKARRLLYDDDAVRRGTVQHEVFYSDNAQAFADNSTLKIKVNCKADAMSYDPLTFLQKKKNKLVKYALVVTLEVDPEIGEEIDIYTTINNRIKEVVRS